MKLKCGRKNIGTDEIHTNYKKSRPNLGGFLPFCGRILKHTLKHTFIV